MLLDSFSSGFSNEIVLPRPATLPARSPSADLSASATIATNTGWGNASVTGPTTVAVGIQPATAAIFTKVGAFALTAGSADSAMVATLPLGAYTAIISGVGSTTGVALAEVYVVP